MPTLVPYSHMKRMVQEGEAAMPAVSARGEEFLAQNSF